MAEKNARLYFWNAIKNLVAVILAGLLKEIDELNVYEECFFFNCYFCFFPLRKDSFTISSGDLGRLTKIWIGHDNTGVAPAWFLDKVRRKN